MAFDQEQGGRLFRLLWVREVRIAQEKPKPTWIAPWEQLREWESATACRVFSLLQKSVFSNVDTSCDWDRERGGRLIRDQWVRTVPLFAPDPNPVLLWSWEEMDEWEREADRGIFERLRAALIPGLLARKSARVATWLAAKAINDVYGIALAGPYSADATLKASQKKAALQVAKLYACSIVEGIGSARAHAERSDRQEYKHACEVGSTLLAHIQQGLVNQDLLEYSEQMAMLGGWYVLAKSRSRSPLTPGVLALLQRPRGYRYCRVRPYPLDERFWIAETYMPRLQGNGKKWAVQLEEKNSRYALYATPEQAAAALEEWLDFQDEIEA